MAEAALLDRLTEWADEIEAEAAALAAEQESADHVRPQHPAVPRSDTGRTQAQLQSRLAELATEQDRQTSLVSRGVIPEDSYVRERDRLTREQLAVTKELSALKNAQPEVESSDRAALVPVMRGLVSRWEITPVETRRNLLRELIHGVWAYPPGVGPDGEAFAAYAVPVPLWEPKPTPIGRRTPGIPPAKP